MENRTKRIEIVRDVLGHTLANLCHGKLNHDVVAKALQDTIDKEIKPMRLQINIIESLSPDTSPTISFVDPLAFIGTNENNTN